MKKKDEKIFKHIQSVYLRYCFSENPLDHIDWNNCSQKEKYKLFKDWNNLKEIHEFLSSEEKMENVDEKNTQFLKQKYYSKQENMIKTLFENLQNSIDTFMTTGFEIIKQNIKKEFFKRPMVIIKNLLNFLNVNQKERKNTIDQIIFYFIFLLVKNQNSNQDESFLLENKYLKNFLKYLINEYKISSSHGQQFSYLIFLSADLLYPPLMNDMIQNKILYKDFFEKNFSYEVFIRNKFKFLFEKEVETTSDLKNWITKYKKSILEKKQIPKGIPICTFNIKSI